MPRANPLYPSQNAGEFSPRMVARVDFSKYANACARLENLYPLPQGGITRRPGTRYIRELKSSAVKGRLLPFQFSTEQAYIIEAGDGIFRFLRDKGTVTVADTDAAVSNGTFDSDITGWLDRSEGSASIGHSFVGSAIVDTLARSQAAAPEFGDSAGTANRRNAGFKFTVSEAVNAASVQIEITNVDTAFTAVAKIYTDSSGSPGTQVGSDSAGVSLASTGVKTLEFGTPIALSAATTYWVVIADTTVGDVNISCCSDQGTDFASGFHDTITSISDTSGSLAANLDFRVRVNGEAEAGDDGRLALNGSGSDYAWAEQEISTTATGTEHVVRFRVVGVPGDKVKVRVGNTKEGDQVLEDFEAAVGYHCVAFTPEESSFFLQFRHNLGKTIYIDDVELLDNEPLELTAPYAEATLPDLRWAQSADVMYIAAGSKPVYKIERRGDTTWSLVQVDWQDGPYLDENTDSALTLQPSATTGKGITITAAGGHTPFGSGDVGRPVRIKHSSTWGWATITEFVSGTSVRADVRRDFGATTAQSAWRLGTWNDDDGWPSAVNFFEQRLVLAGSDEKPQTLWFSQSADLENMRPDSEVSGAIETQDDDALDFTIAADQVNRIRWLAPLQRLVIGTSGGIWNVESDGPVVTPSDIQVRRQTTIGAATITPVATSGDILFLQRGLRKLHQYVYQFETDSYQAPDLTILSDHITESGVCAIDYQQEPDSQIYAVREDGVLPVLTYRREEDVIGWGRYILGGAFGSGDPVVESVAVIPGNETNGTQNTDEVWIIVKRTIDGATKRYIEVFEAPFEGPNFDQYDDEDDFNTAVLAEQEDAWYVDSGLKYDGASTSTITGLDHLEGQTVAIWGDGAIQASKTVASGQITLDTAVEKAIVGLPYTHRYLSLKMTAGAAAGTAVGKTKRIHRIVLILLHTLGVKIGTRVKLRDLPFTSVTIGMDTGVPLFTGEYEVLFDGKHQSDPRIRIEGANPAPFTLLAMAPELQTNEQV